MLVYLKNKKTRSSFKKGWGLCFTDMDLKQQRCVCVNILLQLVALFDRDKSVISRHIKNIFREGEFDKKSVVAKYATTASDGKTYQV